MYGLGMLLVVVLVVLVFANGGGVAYFLDFPSLLVLIGMTLALIVAAGMWRDFVRAFKLLRMSEPSFSRRETEQALASVVFAMRSLPVVGLFGSLSGCVLILAQSDRIGKLPAAFSVALIILLYAILLVLVLMPVSARLRMRLQEME